MSRTIHIWSQEAVKCRRSIAPWGASGGNRAGRAQNGCNAVFHFQQTNAVYIRNQRIHCRTQEAIFKVSDFKLLFLGSEHDRHVNLLIYGQVDRGFRHRRCSAATCEVGTGVGFRGRWDFNPYSFTYSVTIGVALKFHFAIKVDIAHHRVLLDKHFCCFSCD